MFIIFSGLSIVSPSRVEFHLDWFSMWNPSSFYNKGAASPSFFALVGAWALPTERSRFTAMLWCGTEIGMMIGYSSAGYLCVVGFDNGWGSVFYIHGMCGIVFTLCWFLLVFDSPAKHPRITEKERALLYNGLQHNDEKPAAVPWIRILTSLPVWAYFTAHAADSWLTYLLLTCLPMFMNDVLNFDILSNGVFSSLPFLSLAVGLVVASVLADYVSTRQWLRVTNTRKLFQISGNVLTALFLVISGYISCDRRELVILCLCLCTFSESLGLAAGYSCNPVDIAPRFASVIFGISNTLSTIPGFLSPIAVLEMTQHSTREQWLNVFYLTAGIIGVASVVYGLGASSDLAPWSGQEPVEREVEVETHQSSSFRERKENCLLESKRQS